MKLRSDLLLACRKAIEFVAQTGTYDVLIIFFLCYTFLIPFLLYHRENDFGSHLYVENA